MSSSKKQLNWIIKNAKKIAEEYSLTYELKVNGHIKLKFYDLNNKSCMIILSSTPSCRSANLDAICDIRKTLRQKFLINADKSMFSLQLSLGSEI